MNERSGDARNSCGQRAIPGQPLYRATLRVQIHIAVRGSRRGFSRIEEHVPGVAGAMKQIKPATPEPRTGWFRHRQRRGNGNRCIKSISAGIENFAARVGGERMSGGNDRSGRLYGGEGGGLARRGDIRPDRG